MIDSSAILGNVRDDPKLRDLYPLMLRRDQVERITVSRFESARARMRKLTDRGTEMALTLPTGSVLHDGDVVRLTDTQMVVVAREEEPVAVVRLTGSSLGTEGVESAVRIGHALGNLHRPIRVRGVEVCLPIQADTELEMLRKMLAHLSDHVEIRRTMMVFDPDGQGEAHDHDH